jgi:transposase
MALSVGIDWADDHHDVSLLHEDGTVLEAFRFDHSPEGLDELHIAVVRHQTRPDQVMIAIETRHGLLVDELVRRGYRVYPINPKVSDRYRDRFAPSGHKDDGLDARSLAEIMRTDRHLHRPLLLPEEKYVELRMLTNGLRAVIEEKTRLSNQLVACLKDYYQKAVNLFSDQDSAINIAFLKKYPDPVTLAAVTLDQFTAFLKEQKYPCPKNIPNLWARVSAQALTPSTPALNAGTMRMLSLVDLLETTRKHVRLYEKQIQKLLEDLPEADIFNSLPGAGQRLVPEMTAAFGPNMDSAPKLFSQAKELMRLSGTAPITIQTGKRPRSVQRRRACDKRLNRTFFELGRGSVTKSRWAKAYFDDCVKRAVRKTTIYRALACKWIKIAFHLWKTGQSYDEDYHIQQLKNRGVAWAMSL